MEKMNTIEIEKIHAEISKLIAETSKINAEARWYPIVVGATLTGAIAGATLALQKLFS